MVKKFLTLTLAMGLMSGQLLATPAWLNSAKDFVISKQFGAGAGAGLVIGSLLAKYASKRGCPWFSSSDKGSIRGGIPKITKKCSNARCNTVNAADAVKCTECETNFV